MKFFGPGMTNVVADLTPIETAVTAIDGAAVDGLAGVSNSLAYRVHQIESHHHGWERWMGLAVAPDAELHRGDPIGTTVAPFVADAGNETWGDWYQFLGSTDTPTDGAAVYMDMHQIEVVAVERASTIHFVQIAWGASGADALAAGAYSELVYWAGTNVARSAPIPVAMRRVATGTKGWLRVFAVGQNTGTFSFFAGGHEYSG